MENAFSRKGCKILETRLFHLKSNFTVTSTSQNHKKTFSKTWQWHVMSVLHIYTLHLAYPTICCHIFVCEADLHILMLSLSGLVS